MKVFRIKDDLKIFRSLAAHGEMISAVLAPAVAGQVVRQRPDALDFSDFVDPAIPPKTQRLQATVVKQGDDIDGVENLFARHGRIPQELK
jgi:hypothetical protein